MDEIIAWFTENLSAERVSLGVQFLMSGGALTWLATVVNRFKNTAIKQPDDIAKAVEQQIKTTVKTTQEASLKMLESKIDMLNESNKILAESIVLLQSDDPNARLALIENVSKIENIDQQLVQDAKDEVVEVIKEEEEKQEKIDELIEELEKPTL